MRTKIMLFALTISALVATGMFWPTTSYAGQVVPGSTALTPASSVVLPTQFLLTDGHGHDSRLAYSKSSDG